MALLLAQCRQQKLLTLAWMVTSKDAKQWQQRFPCKQKTGINLSCTGWLCLQLFASSHTDMYLIACMQDSCRMQHTVVGTDCANATGNTSQHQNAHRVKGEVRQGKPKVKRDSGESKGKV